MLGVANSHPGLQDLRLKAVLIDEGSGACHLSNPHLRERTSNLRVTQLLLLYHVTQTTLKENGKSHRLSI